MMSEKSLLLATESRRHIRPIVQQWRSSCKYLLHVVLLVVLGLSLLSIRFRPQSTRQVSSSTDIILNNIYGGSLSTVIKENDNLCLTPECIHAASEILYNLNPNQAEWDFCGDFEATVCQGFRERHDLRPDQGDLYQAILMKERAESLMRHVLEGEYSKFNSYESLSRIAQSFEEADELNFLKLKDAYSACLNKDAISNVGLEPLTTILKELDQRGTIPEALMYLANLGIFPLVTAGAGPDAGDPGTVVVYAWPPNFVGLSAKEFYLNHDILKKYTNVLGKVICSSELRDFSVSSCLSVSQDIVQFEKTLAATLPDREDMGNITKTYNKISLSDADEMAPQLHLSSLLQSLSPEGIQVNQIILEIPEYFSKLRDILSETSNDTVREYFKWKALQHFASAIESEALSPWKRLVNELLGKNPASSSERWRTCIQIVDDGLGWTNSRFFVKKAFNAESKQFAEEIVSSIQDQWVTKLEKNDWMEVEVKQQAIRKARNIVRKIGYPNKNPNITDPLDLQKYYHSMNISRDAHFDNVISMNRFQIQSEWSALGKPADWDAWIRPATTVNAWYDPTGNEINLPAGLLQRPIFSPSLPHYLSYGAFGSIAGHELSHAFDNVGRHVDETGNFTDWWTPATVDEFNSRAQCFIPQYDHFAVHDLEPDSHLNVSGKRTLNENIADAGGIGVAFAAWKQRAATEPKISNMDLPGLDNFSQEQLFFVGFANWFCSASTKQMAIKRIYTDSHAPMWVRILGTTRNSREFKQAFGCEVPEPTCELW